MTVERVVVIGATGNVGTSVIRKLTEDPGVMSVVGVARRIPDWTLPKLTWASADVRTDDLNGILRGADVVIHLAWLFQPTHRPEVTWANNVEGSIRVFRAVADAGVPALVHASSVGAYSPGPKDRPVDESWPTHGWPGAAYPREKAYLERVLDAFETSHPSIRVVRMRPAFLFQRGAASQQRRLFAGPFLPHRLVRPSLIAVVPDLPGLVFQALHTQDAAEAYRLAAVGDVRGPFNLAADPVVDARLLAEYLRAQVLRIPAWPVRVALATAWRLHIVPASPGLFDTVLRVPVMDTSRARSELGWTPRHSAKDAVDEFMQGLRQGAGSPTAPLAPRLDGGRLAEIRTGVGEKP
ncbi:NAD-dependent epimerase [Actinosynnema sp. ALI-1.44]|uniref:NAD-dependent epimerase/dehydratase family protein n=1 Tax=Actinosynnema sp. ALI-1.44 TaxID=1933779 RepID=UPI00097BAC3C|nr:NAD-dependent epimerase/dehydratase family protein [Actinosynnema sp. ALI-1.44]ONI76255.1 NAD-dependent epimerase [Actinosynnema sp. ALI-1.44]